MNEVLNISAYRFVPIADPADWRASLWSAAQALQLRGTILLAEEGINLFLAGKADAVRAFLAALRERQGMAGLDAKESWSATAPFRHLRVKVKREIIRMNSPQVRPAAGRAPAVDPARLREWLSQGHDDEGHPVVMLDTRNAFEIGHGRFRGALDWGLSRFGEFPAAARAHRDELAGKTVVSYCTGGIRCEKAALLLGELGVARVMQLEGGILRYLEHTDGAHFDGTCFVFDERVELDAHLQPQAKSPEKIATP